jgi:hypothetical protein
MPSLTDTLFGLHFNLMLFATFSSDRLSWKDEFMKKFKIITVILVFTILSSFSLSNIAGPRPGVKVAICHKGHLIAINPNALDKHLAHGDFEPLFVSWDACSTPASGPISTPL